MAGIGQDLDRFRLRAIHSGAKKNSQEKDS